MIVSTPPLRKTITARSPGSVHLRNFEGGMWAARKRTEGEAQPATSAAVPPLPPIKSSSKLPPSPIDVGVEPAAVRTCEPFTTATSAAQVENAFGLNLLGSNHELVPQAYPCTRPPPAHTHFCALHRMPRPQRAANVASSEATASTHGPLFLNFSTAGVARAEGGTAERVRGACNGVLESVPDAHRAWSPVV
ncbi:hypothetical protein BV22DRAFT_1135203 [Leucogyrophana mollusca]|uniref:Uncharacterized protein n=1 Tax=Leucogyrophana mollusca TaxID=85980 RepID=A0ACB8AWR6_9AGAM|nr:hypothetical protein BV22DRAFT_1135203 [Leucogyrophana mollusca]